MKLFKIENYKYHFKKSIKESKGIIVFIHGFATTSAYHSEFVNRLKDYDYYSLELPGHGFTSIESSKDLTPYKLALHVVKWIELMKFESINLIGHSMGGGIVGMVSTMIPEKIKNLIMVTPMNSSFSFKHINVIKFNPKNNKETLKVQDMLYMDWTKHFKGENDEKIIEETEYQLKHRDNFKKLSRKMSSLSNLLKLRKLEKNINVRSLLIVGKYDGIIDWKSAKKLFSKKNNFKISVFLNSGHLPFIEEPDHYYEIIIGFIQNELKL